MASRYVRKRSVVSPAYLKWTRSLSPSGRKFLKLQYRSIRHAPGPDQRGVREYAQWLATSREGLLRQIAQAASRRGAIDRKPISVHRVAALVRRFFRIPAAAPRARLSVLDVGMGQGKFFKELANELPQVRFSFAGLSLKAPPPITAVKSFVGPIEKKNWCEKFDLVISVHALAYSPHPRLALESIARALKPDGMAILHVPLLDREEKKARFHRLGVQATYDAKKHVLVLTKKKGRSS